jgi:hypothetical protein
MWPARESVGMRVTATWGVTRWLQRLALLVLPQHDSDGTLSLGLKTRMLNKFDGGSG